MCWTLNIFYDILFQYKDITISLSIKKYIAIPRRNTQLCCILSFCILSSKLKKKMLIIRLYTTIISFVFDNNHFWNTYSSKQYLIVMIHINVHPRGNTSRGCKNMPFDILKYICSSKYFCLLDNVILYALYNASG